jgi:trk system potassium uptake protein TrkA
MKSFCIIGLGKLGQTLAESLTADGKEVLVIDLDADKINMIADNVTNAIIGDCTNDAVLKAAGVADYECAIVCIAENINANVLLTLKLKEMGIKTVIARAINDGHRRVLEKVGADMIIFPEKDIGERLAFTLARDRVTDFMEFKGFQIAEITVPEKWIGKTVIELDIRKKFGINIIAVTANDGTVTVSPSATRPFMKGDLVSIVGSDEQVQICLKKFE